MEPKVKILKSWEVAMQVFGIGRVTSRLPETLAQIIRYIMFSGGIGFLVVLVLVITSDSKQFAQKLEAALLLMAGYSGCHKFFVLAANRNEIFKIVDRLNSLLGEIEYVYGPQTLVRSQKLATFILSYYFAQFVVCVVFPLVLYGYYVLYVNGEQDVVLYEMYIPFPTTTPGYFIWVCLYEVSLMLNCVAGLCLGNVLFGVLTTSVVLVLSKVQEHCEQLNPRTSNITIKRIVNWHSEIILIVEDVNRLLGTVFVVEYVMGCAYISFSGYIIMKAGGDSNNNLKKNLMGCILCLFLPLFLAYCGHIIKIQNDQLCRSIYNNEWWQMKPKSRVDLLLLSMMANKGITFHYRKLINFDMTSYFKILKQSYSLVTILKIMDKN